MKLLRDRRFRHLPSFKTTRDREIRDFIVIAVLLGAIAYMLVATLADLLREREALQLRSTISRAGEARDAG